MSARCRPELTAFAALALIFTGCGRGGKPAAAVPEMSVQELKAKLDRKEKFILLDVREPKEYAIAKIEGSTLIPLGSLADRLGEVDRSAQVVVHCKLGGRSAKAVKMLREKGYDAVNLTGGIDAWSVSIDTSVPRY
jgi:adenylyltransferase/sulfurtransferase